MDKNWRKAVCTHSEVNSKVKFIEGQTYFEKADEEKDMMKVIDENGTVVSFSMDAYKKVFGGEVKKLNRNEIMKIQTVFGGNWIELSGNELETKQRVKKLHDKWQDKAEKEGTWMEELDESYFLEKLEICKQLSEALNPDYWESLGAKEIGRRIRMYQDMVLELDENNRRK